MKKYEVKENTIEVNYKNRKSIKAGVSLESENQEPTIIASFDTLKEAQKKLKELKTDIKEKETLSQKTERLAVHCSIWNFIYFCIYYTDYLFAVYQPFSEQIDWRTGVCRAGQL